MLEKIQYSAEDLVSNISFISSSVVNSCYLTFEDFHAYQKFRELCGDPSPVPNLNLEHLIFIKSRLVRELVTEFEELNTIPPESQEEIDKLLKETQKNILQKYYQIFLEYRQMDFSLFNKGTNLSTNIHEEHLIQRVAKIFGFNLKEDGSIDTLLSHLPPESMDHNRFCSEVINQLIPVMENHELEHGLTVPVKRLLVAMADHKFNQIYNSEYQKGTQSFEEKSIAFESGVNFGPHPNYQLTMLESNLFANLDLY